MFREAYFVLKYLRGQRDRLETSYQVLVQHVGIFSRSHSRHEGNLHIIGALMVLAMDLWRQLEGVEQTIE